MITSEEIVTGYNVVWIVSALLVSAYFGITATSKIKNKQFGYALWIMCGVILVSLGTVIHRIFWTLWGWANTHSPQIAEHLISSAVYIGLFSSLLVAVGYAMHLAPITRKFFHKYWWLMVIVSVLIQFWIGVSFHRFFLS